MNAKKTNTTNQRLHGTKVLLPTEYKPDVAEKVVAIYAQSLTSRAFTRNESWACELIEESSSPRVSDGRDNNFEQEWNGILDCEQFFWGVNADPATPLGDRTLTFPSSK